MHLSAAAVNYCRSHCSRYNLTLSCTQQTGSRTPWLIQRSDAVVSTPWFRIPTLDGSV
jgi:hypothetical protein